MTVPRPLHPVKAIPVRRAAVGSVLLLALLTTLPGCGGSAGGSAGPTPPPPPPGPPPAPTPWVDPNPKQGSVPPPNYADSNKVEALNAFNDARSLVGLGPLKQSSTLDVSSQAHVDYMQKNAIRGHGETPGLPGFTGATPQDRTAAAGYSGSTFEVFSAVNSIGTKNPTGKDAIERLLSGPFHRIFMFNYMVSETGIGYDSSVVTNGLLVSDFGFKSTTRQGAPGIDFVLWPIDGATDVPVVTCCEIPKPAGLSQFGYPVSIQTHESRQLKATMFTMTDSAGRDVPVRLVTYENDSNLSGWDAKYFAAIVPPVDLAANTKYIVNFSGALDGKPVVKTWSFTTGNRKLF